MKKIIYTSLFVILTITAFSCSSDDNEIEIENNSVLLKHVSVLYDQANPSVAIDSTVYLLSNGKIYQSEHVDLLGNLTSSNFNYNSNGRLISIVPNGINPSQFFEYNPNGTIASISSIYPSNGAGFKNDFIYLPNKIQVMYSQINSNPSVPSLERELILNANEKLIEERVLFIQGGVTSRIMTYNGTNNIESRDHFVTDLNTMQTTAGGSWNTTYTNELNPVYQIWQNTYGANLKTVLMPHYLSGSLNYDFPTRTFSENIIDTHNVSAGQNWPMIVDYDLDANGNVSEIRYTTNGGSSLYIIEDKFYY